MSPGETGHSKASHIAFALLCGAGFLLLVAKAWVADDAYITFRTVDNLVNGHGLRWNIDDRVQTYTNPLWLFLHVPIYWLSGNIFLTTLGLSLACSTLAVGFVARATRASKPIIALALIAPLLLSLSFIDYTTSGLENPLSFLLFALFVYQLSAPVSGSAHYPVSGSAHYPVSGSAQYPVSSRFFWLRISLIPCLAIVNRMDTALVYIPALALLAACEWRQLRWKQILAGSLPLVAWLAFSLLYYGFPFPNTKYAKLETGIERGEYFLQGLRYYQDLLIRDMPSFGLLVLGVGCTATALRRARTTGGDSRDGQLAAVGLGAILYCLYVIYVGGDFMSGRFVALPLLMFAWLYCASSARQGRTTRQAIQILLVLGLAKLASYLIHPPASYYEHHVVLWVNQQKNFYDGKTSLVAVEDGRLRWRSDASTYKWAQQGIELRDRPPGETVTYGAVGLLGYYAGPQHRLIDEFGLADPLVARLPTEFRRWVPQGYLPIGHFERHVPEGYLHARETGSTDRMDEDLAEYYRHLRQITQDETGLLDPRRLATIARFNLGHYDPLLARYIARAEAKRIR